MAVEDNQEPRENSVDRSRGARSESEEEMSADKEEPGPMSLDLDKLRAVRSAGTKGEWEVTTSGSVPTPGRGRLSAGHWISAEMPIRDAELVVAAVNALQPLLDRIAELEQAYVGSLLKIGDSIESAMAATNRAIRSECRAEKIKVTSVECMSCHKSKRPQDLKDGVCSQCEVDAIAEDARSQA